MKIRCPSNLLSANQVYLINTFDTWLIENNIKKPVIVYCDWHETRSNVYLAKILNEKQIILITFVPNTTHFSQPLDVSFFEPMKSKWGQYARNWVDEKPGRVITKTNFNTVFIPFLLNHFKHACDHVIIGFF